MESFTINLWNEITEKHGKQPTSQHLGIILVLLCLIGGGLVGYFKSIRLIVCGASPNLLLALRN